MILSPLHNYDRRRRKSSGDEQEFLPGPAKFEPGADGMRLASRKLGAMYSSGLEFAGRLGGGSSELAAHLRKHSFYADYHRSSVGSGRKFNRLGLLYGETLQRRGRPVRFRLCTIHKHLRMPPRKVVFSPPPRFTAAGSLADGTGDESGTVGKHRRPRSTHLSIRVWATGHDTAR